MTILVTGASGFLGSKVVEKLAESGENVISISRRYPSLALSKASRNIQWIQHDLSVKCLDPKSLPDFKAVIHLAGKKEIVDKKLDSFLLNNELSTLKLLQSISHKTELFIFASSQMVYGNIVNLSVNEDLPLRPEDSAYACSKVNSENWLKYFQKLNAGRYLSLRFCGFIDGGGFIDYVINQAFLDKTIMLYSNGNVRRDYLSSTNAIDLVMAATNFKGKPGFYPINVGSGQGLTSLEIARFVCNELDSKSKIKLINLEAPKNNFIFCIDRAKKLLDFKPDNLKNSINHYIRKRILENEARK